MDSVLVLEAEVVVVPMNCNFRRSSKNGIVERKRKKISKRELNI